MKRSRILLATTIVFGFMTLTGCGGGGGGGVSAGGGGTADVAGAAPTTATTATVGAPTAAPAAPTAALPGGAAAGGAAAGGAAPTAPTNTNTTTGTNTTGTNTTPTTGATSTPSPTVDMSTVLSLFNGSAQVSATADQLVFQTTDQPDHPSPYWPTGSALYTPYNGSNPAFMLVPGGNILPQDITLRVPRSPQEAATKVATPLGPIGVSRNGVVFFNQYNATNQPLTAEINTFDQYNGHPNPGDMYHYHIEPLYLTQTYGNEAFLGVLLDGFPVYGPVENGRRLTNADLDAYHGHVSATPEFPGGVYHYHITDSDPYINGGQFFGTPGTATN